MMELVLDMENYGTVERSRAWHRRDLFTVHVVLSEIPYHCNIDDINEVAMEINTLYLSEFICRHTPKPNYPLCETIPYQSLMEFMNKRTCPVAEIVGKMGYPLTKSKF